MDSVETLDSKVETAKIQLSAKDLKFWMVDYISKLLSLQPDAIDTAAQFDVFGMDSIEAVVMSGVMEEEFGIPIEPTLLLEYPTIDLFVAANSSRLD